MAVRSRRILGPVVLPVVAAVIYTVPADRTLLIRTCTFFNNTAVPQTTRVGTSASAANSVYWVALPAGPVIAVFTHQVILNPGDQLWGLSTTGVSVCHLFGSLLDGAPA